MDITIIITLIILGVILLIAEVLLLPGTTIALIGSIAAFIASIITSYLWFGMTPAIIVLVVSIVLSIITTLFCLRKKSIRKISLSDTVNYTANKRADNLVNIGEKGTTLTRLAPMGTVMINGHTLEGKTFDGYLDAQTQVYVIGYDDVVVIVSSKPQTNESSL